MEKVKQMGRLIFMVFLGLHGCCCRYDMNAQYCGAINLGMTGPVVMVAKSENCDVVLVDSAGVVVGIPGKYAAARALCESMEKGDTLTIKVSSSIQSTKRGL